MLFSSLTLTNCKKLDVAHGTSKCIIKKIKKEKDECLKSVYEYEYMGKTVYFFTYPCPEGCYALLDEDCNIVKDTNESSICSCSWGGAFCSNDFFINRMNEKLIWQAD